MQTNQIPARADVPAQDKWAIHDLFATDDDWRAALAAFEAQRVFTLEDNRLKRTRYPDAPENLRAWLDQKSFCLIHEEKKLDALYSDSLPRRLVRDYRRIAPVYDFFLKALARSRLGE